jgi:phospholipid/cholesterol/gamma-HCH transport system permease protein
MRRGRRGSFQLHGIGSRQLVLEGPVAFDDGGALWDALRPALAQLEPGTQATLDLSRVPRADGGSMALLVFLRAEASTRGVQLELAGANPQVRQILELYHGDAPPSLPEHMQPEDVLSQVGRETLATVAEVRKVFEFVGQSALELGSVVTAPRTGRWRDLLPLVERVGVNALPVVLLINFLMGLVMAFQGAVQLRQFGAGVFIADLVSLATTRELGPLMTAIILAGRSGAAFAAELGTMTVSEEMDALRTLGFSPWRFLVLPRLLALTLVMPILTLVADAISIAGGIWVASVTLGVGPGAWFSEMRARMGPWDIFSGLLKGTVFAIAIALIACQQGFATSGGAEGVGRRTTSAVVYSLFAIILLDAGFTILFQAFDL